MSSNYPPALPEADRSGEAPLPAKLEPLVESARSLARAATSQNTHRAYAADWRDYLGWRIRQGLEARPLADPETVGLYVAALASGAGRRSVATIERRLSALVWNFAQAGPGLRPPGPPRRHRACGRAPHPWPAAGAERGAHARASRRHARRAAPVRSAQHARPGDPAASASPAGCAAPKSSASTAAPRTRWRARAGWKCSTTDSC